jgi:pantoate--beta-alanine ligase
VPVAITETITELRERLADARAAGKRIALVPTMGALHEGHLSLVDRARQVADVVVVSIFVNPLQFGPSEDLDRYPRDLAADVERLESRGVDFVFAPSVAEMYPHGAAQTSVVAGEVGGLYEGAARAGHFDGVLTVVTKLLGIVAPQTVVFGQKDAQQVFLVERMVAELNSPVTVEVVPIVREAQGLAMSSRNQYLSAEHRAAALALSAGVRAAAASARDGVVAALDAARAILAAEPLVKLDYLVAVNPTSFLIVDSDFRGPAVILVAALVGTTRLIDNAAMQLG